MMNNGLKRGFFSGFGCTCPLWSCVVKRLWLSLVLSSLVGCAYLPGSAEFSSAAILAAKDPFTWAPVMGAVVVAVDEDHLQRHASQENPLFGSREKADRLSSDLNIVLNVAAALSSVVVPEDRQENMLQDAVALTAAAGTTVALKKLVDRERPDHSGNDSFPSGHTSQAFAAARVVRDNLHDYGWRQGAEVCADIGVYTMATATGWARLESGEHHPVDVFIGAAIGNFMVVFVNESMKGNKQRLMQANVAVDPVTSAVQLNLDWQF